MNRTKFTASQYFHKDFDDRLELTAELVSQDATTKESTFEITLRLYNQNLVLGNNESFQISTYVDGYLIRPIDSFFYTQPHTQGNSYAILDYKQVTFFHSAIHGTNPLVGIEVKVNFKGYSWEDPEGKEEKIQGTFEDGVSVYTLTEPPTITESPIVTYAPTFTDDKYYTIQISCDKYAIERYAELELQITATTGSPYSPWIFVVRDISDFPDYNVPNKSYTFEFTDDEIQILQEKFYNTNSFFTSVSLKTTFTDGTIEWDSVSDFIGRIIEQPPTITNATVKQANSTIVELTGDENVMVYGEGMAEFQYTPTVYKQADFRKMTIINGIQSVTDMPQGIIDDPTSGDFHITVTDTRGLEAKEVITKPIVPYFRPTIYQKVTNIHTGEVGSLVTLGIDGTFYNGSFGAVDNNIVLEIRYTEIDGTEMGNWVNVSSYLNITEHTFKATIEVGEFVYNVPYTFQCRITDKLHTVITDQYTTTIEPIFDWSNEDFNFNMPVNMFGNTVLRHNKDGGNTVLSGNEGHIYLRPAGTSDTTNETIFYANGDVNINGGMLYQGTPMDFVIEYGYTDSWYWRKWYSGRAECWGTEYKYDTAVTTAWGGLYRSDNIYPRSYPEELFILTPEYTSIELGSTSKGCWIIRHDSTGAHYEHPGPYAVVRPASATIDRLVINFHAIGRWK